MNAQQIYWYMYFTNLTALISILSIFMVGHDFCENIIVSKHGVQATELQQEA